MGPGIDAFVRESNLIEGIDDPAWESAHAMALELFLDRESLLIGDLINFTRVIQPMAHGKHNGLRIDVGMNVRVGDHVPPPGGPHITDKLKALLGVVNEDAEDPFDLHHQYEQLHPFMDGNGRSGRALWAWQMHRFHGYRFQRTFLHLWYYQSLDHA